MDHKNKVKSAEIKLAVFYAEHNIAFEILQHMVPLLKEICINPQVVKDLSLSAKKCSKIITNVVARVEIEKTIQILKHQTFSILVDETTDISNDKLFCILVKYISPSTKKKYYGII